MEIIFLHWGENYFPWKIIFHHLPYQTTENRKIFSRKIVFPLTKHYLNLTLFFSEARIFLVPINFPLGPMSSTRLLLLSMTHVSIFHNHFFFWCVVLKTYRFNLSHCKLDTPFFRCVVLSFKLQGPERSCRPNFFNLTDSICYVVFFTFKNLLYWLFYIQNFFNLTN